ncbi:MAG: RNA polymerase subunit sigma-24, partial [Spirochaetae bacterium HGW-Spirochaetae-5]
MKLKDKLSDPGTDRFVENYDSYYSIVFNSIYSKTGNFHDSEDICQEVF